MRTAVIVFPGSNCDHDAYHVIKKYLIKMQILFGTKKEVYKNMILF